MIFRLSFDQKIPSHLFYFSFVLPIFKHHCFMKKLLFLFVSFLWLATASAQTFKPENPVPTDPLVRTGTLPNGLKYYIRKNAKPEHRAELRLVVNAGSMLETDNQQGLAHF